MADAPSVLRGPPLASHTFSDLDEAGPSPLNDTAPPVNSSPAPLFTLPLLAAPLPLPPSSVLVASSQLSYHYSTRAERDKARKRAKRTQLRTQSFANNHEPRPAVVAKNVVPSAAIPVAISIQDLPANSSGYEALAKGSSHPVPLRYEELVADGYEVIEWDGKESLILVDASTGKIFTACVGMPDTASYEDTCRIAADFMLELGRTESFTEDDRTHKRGGNFPVLNAGILAGHGPPHPYNLLNAGHEDAVDRLLRNSAIRRLALLQDAAFKLYAPDLYDYYHRHTVPLRQHRRDLRVNWELSIFSAAAFNLGPQVVTHLHRDCIKLSFGWCAIHALGRFDHTKGGHLVLKEPKVIIQFPPGALILVPSATITHGNTPIQDGEVRVSFTQYSSAAMFRYVDNGMRTQDQLCKADKRGYAKMAAAKGDRWRLGLELWGTAEEILQRAGVREDGELAE